MLPGADVDLSGKKLTACETLISHKNGNEGVYLGMAQKGDNSYLVVGQLILECITILVRTGTDEAVTLDDALFGKVVSMPGRHVDIAWEKLGQAMDEDAEGCLAPAPVREGVTSYTHKHCHRQLHISVCVFVYN